MYLGDETTCLVCGHKYRPAYSGGSAASSGCPKCAKVEADKKKREHFEMLDAMSIEDRIRRIEEIIYNKQTEKRPSCNVY